MTVGEIAGAAGGDPTTTAPASPLASGTRNSGAGPGPAGVSTFPVVEALALGAGSESPARLGRMLVIPAARTPEVTVMTTAAFNVDIPAKPSELVLRALA